MLSTLRRVILPIVAPLFSRFTDSVGSDLYISYDQNRNEFVGLTKHSKDELEEALGKIGFEPNPVAAWKTLNDTSHAEQLSMRRVTQTEPFGGIQRPTRLSEYDGDAFQLHVVCYELDGDSGTTAVFAHHEFAWDAYPIKHYQADYYSSAYGKQLTRGLFQDHGLHLDTDTTIAEVCEEHGDGT